ncbi:poliovirus receptor homolog [Suncus etruscus]|uniref:poliovirus receptor homolog n=1 Tax=Suncus etruscus TaxID=109475 RepID=UPI002110705F|nr:poliovirus receptor homolog [Suncus etruscus]
MAWTPLRLLLLPLLPLFWASTRAGDRKVVLLAPPEVCGSPGDTVNLTCVLQPVESEIPQVKQIRWEKLEPWGDLSTVAEFDRDQGPNITEPNRVQFISAGKDPDLLDASLTLTELHPDDDANYTCEVTTFLQGSGRASTWVRVFYAPQVSISLYDDFGHQGHRETSLSCDARGNPEPRNYEWSTTKGPLPPYAVPHGARLLLQPSKESINTTFICQVSNTLGTARVAMKVLLSVPWRIEVENEVPSVLHLKPAPVPFGHSTYLLKGLLEKLPGFQGEPSGLHLWDTGLQGDSKD